VISYRLLLALTALGLTIYMWWWRRRSRAAWRAYDAQHHGDDNPLRPSAAAGLARHHDKLDLERDNPRVP